MKFTITDFRKMFPDDTACLEAIMYIRYGDLKKCPRCKKATKFHRVKKRTCYECQWCGHQLYPMQGTIFEKSTTPLSLWFYAIYLMTATRSVVSAKEIQRQLGVTYKCAWRIAHQIRSLMGNDPSDKLSGIIEMDETYVGGKPRNPKIRNKKKVNPETGRGTKKIPVVGMVERQGKIRANVRLDRVLNYDKMKSLAQENIDLDKSTVITDQYPSYKRFSSFVKHKTIDHRFYYVVGDIHTNTIEGYWSQLKRSIRGTHVWVSRKHLQKYIDEFAFRYNQRENESLMFFALLDNLTKPFVSAL